MPLPQKHLRRRRVALVDSLELRRMLSVTVANPLLNLSVTPGATSTSLPLSGVFASDSIQGTVVRFATTAGLNGPESDIDIELYDTAWGGHTAAPISTANFLNYVNSGRYANTFFHRATDFAGDSGPAVFLQGGGFTRTSAGQYGNVSTDAPINLEYSSTRPNVRGTIAYARTSDVNSATSGFFFNVQSNPSFDATGNQYAVFGQVIGNGLSVLDEYAALKRVNAGGAFATLPLTNTSNVSLDNTVLITSASVISNPNSALSYGVQSSDAGVATASLDGNGNVVVSYGSKVGTATITVTATDLTGASTQATFSATVAVPHLTVRDGSGNALSDGGSVSLPDATAGASSTSFTLTLTNSGGAQLNLSSIELGAPFTMHAPLTPLLDPGASENVVITIDTSAVTSATRDLVVSSDDPSRTFTLHVSGTVVAAPALAVSSGGGTLSSGATLSVPDAHVGDDPSDPHFQTITLTNTGQSDLTITGVSVPAGYRLVTSPGTTIAGGASTTLSVAIDPTVATPGVVTGTLAISSDAGDAFSLTLSGVLERTWVLNAAHPSLTFTDADGTKATLTLKGPGSVTLGLFSAADPTVKGKAATLAGTGTVNSATISGTTAASTITASGKGGDNGIAIPFINAFAPIGTLSFAPVSVSGTLALASAKTVTVAALSGSAMFSGAVTTASAASVANASLRGGDVKTLTVKGAITSSTLDFSGTVTTASAASVASSSLHAGAAKTLAVKGAVTSSTLDFSGAVGTISAAQLSGSTIRVGVTSTGTPASAGDFSSASTLGTLSLTSKSAGAFSNSSLFAANVTTAKLGTFSANSEDTDTVVLRSAKSLTGKGPSNKAFSLKSVSVASAATATAALTTAGLPTGRFALTVI